jgi:hypothetical protein
MDKVLSAFLAVCNNQSKHSVWQKDIISQSIFNPKHPTKNRDMPKVLTKHINHSRTCNIYTFRLANKKVEIPQNRDRI